MEGNNRGRKKGGGAGCVASPTSNHQGKEGMIKARKGSGQHDGRQDETRRQSKARRDNTSNINEKENKQRRVTKLTNY